MAKILCNNLKCKHNFCCECEKEEITLIISENRFLECSERTDRKPRKRRVTNDRRHNQNYTV